MTERGAKPVRLVRVVASVRKRGAHVYEYPRVVLDGKWMRALGVEIGDQVVVTMLRPGHLLLTATAPKKKKPAAAPVLDDPELIAQELDRIRERAGLYLDRGRWRR